MRPEKVTKVSELKAAMAQATGIYFCDFTGMGAQEFNRLRRSLKGAVVKVVKNRLALKAFEELTGLTDSKRVFTGPTCLLLSTDEPVEVARRVKELISALTGFRVKGVYIDNELYWDEYFDFLASLPPKDRLYQELLSLFQYPLVQLCGVLAGMFSDLILSLEAVLKKKEEE